MNLTTLYKKATNIISSRSRLIHRAVAFSSLLWLVAALPHLALHNGGVEPFFTPGTGFVDLAQFYMGGSIALANDYKSLYPDPKENIHGNLGIVENSTPKPGYSQLAESKGVEDSIRYILPPPTALLLSPYAMLPYPTAYRAWIYAFGLFIWLSCALAYRTARHCGISQLAGTVWWFFMAFSPLNIHSIRIANCTPFLTVALGLAAFGIYKNKTALTVSMCIIAGLLKGTSIVFAPLILFMKRWRIILWGGITVLVINLITILITGWNVYEEFLTVVLPSTRVIVLNEYNRSVYACLHRMFGDAALAGLPALATRITALMLGATLLALIWKMRSRFQKEPAAFNAAVIALLGLYMIFSPYAWVHYCLCYIPFLPALWIALKPARLKILMTIFCFGIWLPPNLNFFSALPTLPEPFASHLLLGQIGIIALALYVLIRNIRQTSAR